MKSRILGSPSSTGTAKRQAVYSRKRSLHELDMSVRIKDVLTFFDATKSTAVVSVEFLN